MAAEKLVGKNGSGYRGKQNRSRSGKKCKAWAKTNVYTQDYNESLQKNYCRNPDP